MNDNRSHSPLLVPPSNQDWMQGVLSVKVVLVMYGDYQDPGSADVYKLIKRIKQELSAASGKMIYALSSDIFRKHKFILMLNEPPKLLKPPLPKDSFGQCTILYLFINRS